MRPLLISLLLFCMLLAAADAAAGDKCVKALITGVEDTEFDFTANLLKCKTDKVIMLDGIRYEELKCDDNTGWNVDKGNPKTSTDELDITCDAKAATCDQVLIDGYDTSQMEYIANKLTCKEPYKILKYKDGSYKTSTSLECPITANDKWKAESGDTTIKNTDKITVSCEAPCTQGLIVTDGVKSTLGPPFKLSCEGNKELQIDTDTATLHKTLTCDETSKQWLNTEKLATDPFTVTCVTPPCAASLITNLDRDKMSYNNFVLKCNDADHVLKINGENYDELTCNSDIWSTRPTKTPPTSPFSVNCVPKPCANSKFVPNPDPNNPTPGGHFIPGTAEMFSAISEEGITVFKCLGTEKDTETQIVKAVPAKLADPKNVIKLNKKFVFSHPKCDATNGYTDVAGKQLAGAFDKVELECVNAGCTMRSPLNCNALDNITPKGYKCILDTHKHSPFHLTDDPNFLKCNSMQRLFDASTAKFVTTTALRCSDDNKWHKIDHPEEVQDEEKLICLQLTCNKCAELTAITAVKSTFVAGTAENCATSECKNNLWEVKREGGVTEEYAGEVKCSSEDTTNSKWLDIDNTVIPEASCIPEAKHATVKCTVASKLVTKCDDAWNAHGCSETPLADIGDNVCGTKKMFYKEKGFYGFQGEATKINCVQGVWKLTTASGEVPLTRGGTVICANANPAPTTTTLAPTTTTPYVNPCLVCRENSTMDCEKCNTKSEAIQYKVSDDKQSCTATARFDAPFQTEKKKEIKGNLTCNKIEKIWKTEDGTEVGKFAAALEEPEENDNLWIIVGGGVGGVVVLIVIFAVIFKVCIDKKRPVDKDQETKKKMLEESKKKKTKLGDNDDILDEVSVEAPNELKL